MLVANVCLHVGPYTRHGNQVHEHICGFKFIIIFVLRSVFAQLKLFAKRLDSVAISRNFACRGDGVANETSAHIIIKTATETNFTLWTNER